MRYVENRDVMATPLPFLPRNGTPLVPHYSFSRSLLSTYYVHGIVLSAVIFEMTKLFVYVGSDPALEVFLT